jgi:hypothetical protein
MQEALLCNEHCHQIYRQTNIEVQPYTQKDALDQVEKTWTQVQEAECHVHIEADA